MLFLWIFLSILAYIFIGAISFYTYQCIAYGHTNRWEADADDFLLIILWPLEVPCGIMYLIYRLIVGGTKALIDYIIKCINKE